MSAALKSKLEKLEAKAATRTQQNGHNSTEILLLHYEYLNRALVLYSRAHHDPEEKRRQEQQQQDETVREVLKMCSEYEKMSNEQRREYDAKSDAEIEKKNQEFMAWYNSPDRLKFDEAYENKSKGQVASEDLEPVIPSMLK